MVHHPCDVMTAPSADELITCRYVRREAGASDRSVDLEGLVRMREDVHREDSDWVCDRCGRRFFREKDARVHVFKRHRKKTGKADKGAHLRH